MNRLTQVKFYNACELLPAVSTVHFRRSIHTMQSRALAPFSTPNIVQCATARKKLHKLAWWSYVSDRVRTSEGGLGDVFGAIHRVLFLDN
jgi:hypothetical protein